MRAALALALLAPAVMAQTAPTPIAARSDALVAILDGGGDYPTYFAPSFQQAVSQPQLAAVIAQLKDALGRPLRIAAAVPEGPWSTTLTVAYERGTATVRLAVDPADPHRVTGLLVTGTTTADDSFARLQANFQALPGASGFGVYVLGDGAPKPIAAWHDDAPAPLGSAFKLWLLAEASRQVAVGERHWADVVPLGAPSLPSGILQGWPTGTPLTLQSLATLMVSISDNTAADTVLAVLGRDRVDRMVTRAGAAHPETTLPVLSTREAFVLKADPALVARWRSATPGQRRALLAANAARIAAAPLSAALFAGQPVATDSVEWFASPADMARLLDWLRVHGDPTTHAILAANAGTDTATRERYGYIGFKGGSEPGVVTLNYLIRAKDGRWLAVTGNWHRIDADTPTLTFAALMNRALALAAH